MQRVVQYMYLVCILVLIESTLESRARENCPEYYFVDDDDAQQQQLLLPIIIIIMLA